MSDAELDRGYDIIGDVHGCAHTLERLLEQMGYRRLNGVWQHPRRQALFLGDIIDRGPRIREAMHLVRDMVEQGRRAASWAITSSTPSAGKRPHRPAAGAATCASIPSGIIA